MSFLTMQQEVSRLIQRRVTDATTVPPTYDQVFWTDAEVKDAINKANLEMVERSRFLRSLSAQLPVTGSNPLVALPANLIEVVDIFLTYQGSSEVQIYQTSISELGEYNAWRTATGRPVGFYLEENDPKTLRLWPIPSVSSTLRVVGHYAPATLVADVDVPELPPQTHQGICYKGAIFCLEKSYDAGEVAKMGLFEKRYEEYLFRTTDEANENFSRAAREIPYRHL